ncbi:hypothetical protein HRbin15_00486 [bacterium HR15]|nr:hypothetical protein HRbin15_00486 [bacterium HR15]
MKNQSAVKEKVKLNGVEYEISLAPVLPETTNEPSRNPAIMPAAPSTPQEIVRQAPSVTQLPRWEDGGLR